MTNTGVLLVATLAAMHPHPRPLCHGARGGKHQRAAGDNVGRSAPSPRPLCHRARVANTGVLLAATLAAACPHPQPLSHRARGDKYRRSAGDNVGRNAPSPPAPLPQGTRWQTPACCWRQRWPQRALTPGPSATGYGVANIDPTLAPTMLAIKSAAPLAGWLCWKVGSPLPWPARCGNAGAAFTV